VKRVIAKHGSGGAAESGNWGFPFILGAIAFFGVLSMLPTILPALHLQLYVTAPAKSYGVTLMLAPREPRPVHVPAAAQPVSPDLSPAKPPTASPVREKALAAAENKRLHVMLFAADRPSAPQLIPVPGSLPTLVLTRGQGSYTAAMLVRYGALVLLPHHAARLLDNVYVGTSATLDLGGPDLRTLYLDSGRSGFATIVAQNGNLTFAGTTRHPMTITSWDWSTNSPGVDAGYGRSYICDAGGDMTFTDVHVSSLGFGSGQTAGVAWTGFSGRPGTGGAMSSAFTGNTYGAFVSQGSGMTFRDDLFESNEVDGVNIHKYSVHSSVIASSAVRNGDNGFTVDPAAHDTVLESDISEHNSRNGYFIDGVPPVVSAPASGMSIAPTASMLLGSGTRIEDSTAAGNGKIGILVEGGTGTVIKGNQLCSSGAAVAIKDDSANAVITGNTVRCTPPFAFSVGPSAPGTVLSGNAVDGAKTGILIRDAGHVQLYRNLVTRATKFGIRVAGATSSVSGADNVIAGTGFQAIDARAGAPAPGLYASNLSGWPRPKRKSSFWDYLLFHPLATMWLSILFLVLLAWILARIRRMPPVPYPAATRWRREAGPAAAASPGQPTVSTARTTGRAGLGRRFPDRAVQGYGPAVAARRPVPAARHAARSRQGSDESAHPPWATAPMPKLVPRPSDHDGTFPPWSQEASPE
jgi:hypothetical protein